VFLSSKLYDDHAKPISYQLEEKTYTIDGHWVKDVLEAAKTEKVDDFEITIVDAFGKLVSHVGVQ
jgi:hypothetical protein